MILPPCGVNLGCAALQQTISEPAGRSAKVRAHEPVHINLEVIQSALEFEAAAAEVAQPLP